MNICVKKKLKINAFLTMAMVRKLSQSVMTGVLTPTQGQIIRFREHGTENETIDISA